MKKKNLLIILLISCVANLYSQESKNLILQFYGYNDNPYKVAFITNNLPADANQDDIQKLNDYYDLNEKDILAKYDQESYSYYLEVLVKKREKNQQDMAVGLNIVASAVTQGVAAGKQRQAEINQQKAEKEAQLQAEQQTRVAQNKQKYADFQAMTSKSVHSSDYQTNAVSNSTQHSSSDMLTSDMNRNKQIQMSVHQYGMEQTHKMIKEDRIKSAKTNGTTGGYDGKIISAVTETRQAIKIQLGGNKIGDRVIAYSLNAKIGGQQDWMATDGIISKCDATLEFLYETTIRVGRNMIKVYFDM